jgi:DNA-binding NarL/FixJ family response regulator
MAEIMNRLHLENRAQVLAYAGQMGWMSHKPNN